MAPFDFTDQFSSFRAAERHWAVLELYRRHIHQDAAAARVQNHDRAQFGATIILFATHLPQRTWHRLDAGGFDQQRGAIAALLVNMPRWGSAHLCPAFWDFFT